jgi:hypothetical protein
VNADYRERFGATSEDEFRFLPPEGDEAPPDPETLALAMLDVAERAGSDDEAADAIRRIAAAGGGGAPFRGAERPRPAPRPNPYA